MFRQIIVPLDGSKRAERAVPVAANIARACNGTVILLHTVKPIIDYGYAPYLVRSSSLTDAMLVQDLESAKNYLYTVSHMEALAGIKTEIVAMSGIAAPIILAYARLYKTDLIVMSSHGYTGLKRWAMGSVTQKVVRHSPVPVLVLREGSPRPGELQSAEAQPLRALVALDGSELAETVLTPAVQLVSALAAPGQGELHLMRIVKVPSEYDYKKAVIDILEEVQHEATNYLAAVAGRLSNGIAAEYNVKVTWSVLSSSEIAAALIEAAEFGNAEGTCQGCNLIAIATHGRGGLQRWVTGSVTERVLDGTRLPLFIVRPQQAPIVTGAGPQGEGQVVMKVGTP